LLIIEDNGIGIPDIKKERVFEKSFLRKKGLGLYFVSEILSITGMTIRETGIPGEGARLEIGIPSGAFRFID
jgi:signal transduction histidine kinase